MRSLKTLLIVVIGITIFAACQGSDQPLQANAGDDFSVKVGEAPNFDGCASTGDMINYKWTIISAPDPMASDEGKVIREVDGNCSFTLESQMGLDEVGEWLIELEVQDENGQSSTDTVQVQVTS